MKPHAAALSTLCTLVAALSLVPDAQARSERPPNVIYVLADDLGWGELGCYGQTKIRTPNIDRLAREGLRFTRHYSGSPVCAPSRCVLLTGRHTGHAIVRDNWENGGWDEGDPEGQYPLPEGTPTVARRLQSVGYATAAIGKWGLGGPETSGAPNLQGFDLFLGYLCQRVAHNYYPTHLWRNAERLPLDGNDWFHSHQRLAEPLPARGDYYERFQRRTYAPDVMIDEALRFVVDHREGPFFLYFASPIPHGGLQVPPEDLRAYPEEWDTGPYLGHQGYVPHPRPRAAYAAMVSRLDRDVGRLLDLLDELGIAEETLVMFSSDNGPTFNGGTDSTFFESAAGMRGLKCSVYEGGIRVPLVARWPGHVAAGATTDHLSGFQDLMPTLLELAGLGPQPGIDGKSFAPTLLGHGVQAQHEYLYWEYAGQQALRTEVWKVVRSGLRQGDLRVQLYHLDADPGETTDVADQYHDVTPELTALLDAARTPSEAFPQPALDDR